jgi:hypothetical protein
MKSGDRMLGLAVAATWAAMLFTRDAQAYRMIQNTSPGRTSTGAKVLCNDLTGFAHWTRGAIEWRLNTTGQGGKPGVPAALQAALAAWTAVSPAGYQLDYAGTTNGAFATDGVNTVVWATGNGCTGGCLAITALVLGPGQVIQEADVSFNDAFTWNTNGSDYDVQAIAAHELGHCMGIHHTEITKPRNRPTMYASYFGTDGRTLEADDRDALNCAYGRYAPAALVAEDQSAAGERPDDGPALVAHVQSGHASLRFALREPGRVRLELFDVAGRRVAMLADGMRGAGEHEVACDGAGHRGVYFARLITPEGRRSATVFLSQ